jgi:hypothetical protein
MTLTIYSGNETRGFTIDIELLLDYRLFSKNKSDMHFKAVK